MDRCPDSTSASVSRVVASVTPIVLSWTSHYLNFIHLASATIVCLQCSQTGNLIFHPTVLRGGTFQRRLGHEPREFINYYIIMGGVSIEVWICLLSLSCIWAQSPHDIFCHVLIHKRVLGRRSSSKLKFPASELEPRKCRLLITCSVCCTLLWQRATNWNVICIRQNVLHLAGTRFQLLGCLSNIPRTLVQASEPIKLNTHTSNPSRPSSAQRESEASLD